MFVSFEEVDNPRIRLTLFIEASNISSDMMNDLSPDQFLAQLAIPTNIVPRAQNGNIPLAKESDLSIKKTEINNSNQARSNFSLDEFNNHQEGWSRIEDIFTTKEIDHVRTRFKDDLGQNFSKLCDDLYFNRMNKNEKKKEDLRKLHKNMKSLIFNIRWNENKKIPDTIQMEGNKSRPVTIDDFSKFLRQDIVHYCKQTFEKEIKAKDFMNRPYV